jgi:hypothetical protein
MPDLLAQDEPLRANYMMVPGHPADSLVIELKQNRATHLGRHSRMPCSEIQFVHQTKV